MSVLFIRFVVLLCWLTVVSSAALRAAPFNAEALGSVVSVLPKHSMEEKQSRQQATAEPEGTAVAVFAGGYLATNAHVLGRAKKSVVRLSDGRLFAAELIAKDSRTDLALLKIPVDLPLLHIADTPELGSPVCAIGNPFGLGLSVSCGVVSALRRTSAGFYPVEDFIQTDAAVNPGGSGGALVNEAGHLVGLTTAIYTKKNKANIGISFAISSALMFRILEDLREYGHVLRIHSGLLVRPLLESQRQATAGARVIRVENNSAAARAKFQAGDILTKIGDWIIHQPSDVTTAFQYLRPGSSVRVHFLRAGNPQAVRFEAD